MLDFDGTEHGTQNSAIFDLEICFLNIKIPRKLFPKKKKNKSLPRIWKTQAFQTGDGQVSFLFHKSGDFDGTEHGTQNSAIFDLEICFLRPALLIFRRLEFCMKNTASNSEET
ncbi:unnamed protein product [Rhizophagus irregularis]|nr:unnamed protein product [Rhizophagus irregularis]